MHITYDNIEFEIYLNDTKSSIHIKSKKNNNNYVLSIPINLKNEELEQYLHTHAKKLITAFEKKNFQLEMNKIELYGKSYPYQWKPNLASSYLKNGVIYSSISTRSTPNVKKICRDILSYDIRIVIGLWEERLNCLIENISLGSFKTKQFKICSISNTIRFSTHLMNRHTDYLEFVVTKAVLTYLKLDTDKQQVIMEKYLKDYKQNKKIFEYENGR